MLGPTGEASGATGVAGGKVDEGAGMPCGRLGEVWGLWAGGVEQLTKLPTIASNIRIFVMTLLILEALGALLLLVLIVWWTMFSGRNKGELPTDTKEVGTDDPKK
jgi:hypothetical protein